MRIVMLIEGWHIALIVVGALILVAGIVVLLNFTLLSGMRAKRQVRDLSRKFEYLHALLMGQDSQYLSRIESVSLTNLLYVDTHAKFSKRFKDIRDNSDSYAQATINGLKDCVNERDYKKLKAELPRAREIIDNYEEEVNTLNNDLLIVVRPEEECKRLSLLLKEELRKIKQDYFIKQSDLSLVSVSFDETFRLIDDRFKDFEDLVEGAHYDEAKNILPEIKQILTELSRCLQALPNLCVTITTIIPDRIASLQNRYEEMVRADFPLHHLIVKGNIEDMNNLLDEIIVRVKSFDLRGVEEDLDSIIARIDEYFELFDKEKDARLVFENECEDVYSFASSVDRKNIRLSNSLPSVRQIYIISQDAQQSIDAIGNFINKAGATKRSLDTYIHSGTKQPFSILVEKMQALRDETEQASSAIDDFERYLQSLKTDVETAANEISSYYEKLHHAEVLLRRIEIPAVTEKYSSSLEECYRLIDAIYGRIYSMPIDVGLVNADVASLTDLGTNVVEGIQRDYDLSKKAESAILYANRDRHRFGEVDDALKQTEAFFYAGDFARAYEETLASLRRLNGD